MPSAVMPRIEVPPSLMFVPEIRALLEEGRELSSEDFRRVAVCLRKTLNTTTTSDNDTYKCPSTHKLLIERVHPHLCITDLSAETAAVATGIILSTTAGYVEREAFKAGNCRLEMLNNDTQERLIGENRTTTLRHLFFDAYDWRKAPHILTPGQTLQMNVSLIDTASDVVGAGTEYGLILSALLVRVRQS